WIWCSMFTNGTARKYNAPTSFVGGGPAGGGVDGVGVGVGVGTGVEVGTGVGVGVAVGTGVGVGVGMTITGGGCTSVSNGFSCVPGFWVAGSKKSGSMPPRSSPFAALPKVEGGLADGVALGFGDSLASGSLLFEAP